jgi:hypothetical protein
MADEPIKNEATSNNGPQEDSRRSSSTQCKLCNASSENVKELELVTSVTGRGSKSAILLYPPYISISAL